MIIYKNGITSCPTDILGNVIMAYNRWTSQLYKLNTRWIIKEKSQVYRDIYQRAYFNIMFCCYITSPVFMIYITVLVFVLIIVGYLSIREIIKIYTSQRRMD